MHGGAKCPYDTPTGFSIGLHCLFQQFGSFDFRMSRWSRMCSNDDAHTEQIAATALLANQQFPNRGFAASLARWNS